MYLRCLFGLICLSLLAYGCAGPISATMPGALTTTLPWKYADLRRIDPIDSRQPTQELVAAYSRLDEDNLDLRFDLLELAEVPDFDLYLAFDLLPGGETSLPIQAKPGFGWEALYKIPAYGDIEVTLGKAAKPLSDSFAKIPSAPGGPALDSPGLRLRRDPRMDSLSISLLRASLADLYPAHSTSVQTWLTPPGRTDVVDGMGPFPLNAPPPAPAQVLLAFWNSLPAYTPLQALRRWDGAHTGPLGGRHGLLHLLRAARQTNSPLFLLDLNQPTSLSTLEFFDQANLVQQMEISGQLDLPRVVPGLPPANGELQAPEWALAHMIEINKQAAIDSGHTASSGWFIPGGLPDLAVLAKTVTGHGRQIAFMADGIFSSRNDSGEIRFTRPIGWQNWMILPVPGMNQDAVIETQVDRDGLTLETKAALVETALAAAHSPPGAAPLLVLGGDLPASAWGNPEIARNAMVYIRDHPWMRLLASDDLARLAPGVPLAVDDSTFNPSSTWQPTWLEELRSTSDNPLGLAAWQALHALFAPTFPSSNKLAELRKSYAGQIAVLLAGARWAEHPTPQAGCSSDLDGDGQSECLLASDRVLAVFEKENGGGLAYLFIRDPNGDPHQIISPSSLLITGQSPADSWDFAAGLLADPDTLPGAFFSSNTSLDSEPVLDPKSDSLHFYAQSGKIKKVIRLLDDGIEVSIKDFSGDAAPLSLPIILDPWLRFETGWTERCKSSLDGHTWRWACSGIEVEVQCNVPLTAMNSIDGSEGLNRPENPDQDVLPEQRLSFPLALAKMPASEDLNCTIRLR